MVNKGDEFSDFLIHMTHTYFNYRELCVISPKLGKNNGSVMGRMDGWSDGRMDGRTNGPTDLQTYLGLTLIDLVPD